MIDFNWSTLLDRGGGVGEYYVHYGKGAIISSHIEVNDYYGSIGRT